LGWGEEWTKKKEKKEKEKEKETQRKEKKKENKAHLQRPRNSLLSRPFLARASLIKGDQAGPWKGREAGREGTATAGLSTVTTGGGSTVTTDTSIGVGLAGGFPPVGILCRIAWATEV